jgi:hypothetical protein
MGAAMPGEAAAGCTAISVGAFADLLTAVVDAITWIALRPSQTASAKGIQFWYGDIIFRRPARSLRSWRKFVVARQIVGNLEPTGFAAHKDVALRAHAGIIVESAEGDSKLVESLGMAGDQPKIRLGSI